MTTIQELPRKLLDVACRIRVCETLHGDDELVDVAAHALKTATKGAALLDRAEALHLNTGMPWCQAEEAALSEAGIQDAEIDELIGECAGLGMDSLITGEDELRRFARAVLVYGQGLLREKVQQALDA